jgi:hypothetical protein
VPAAPPSAPFVAMNSTAPVSLAQRFRDLRTPYDFGAKGVVGGTPQDDTAVLNAALKQLGDEGGGRIYLPGTFYAAGALVSAPNVEIYGDFTPTYSPSHSYFSVGGSKLILGKGGLKLDNNSIFRNCMVIASNLPKSNPRTAAAAAGFISQMPSNGVGITLAGDNCMLDSLQVLGFNHGIYCDGNANRHMLRNIHGDNVNSIWLATGGDMCHIIGGHLWPYLTATAPGPAEYYRSGYGIYTKHNGGSIQIAQVTAYGYQVDFMADTNSVTYDQCWADGIGNLGSTGYGTVGACGIIQLNSCISVAQQYSVHHSPSNGAVFNIGAGCQLGAGGPGGTGERMSCCALADGRGPVQSIGGCYSGGDCAFNLGEHSGASVIIGNMFDDEAGNWDHIWNVEPSVLPLLTKFGNRVVNSKRGFSEQAVGTPEMRGVAVYDMLPNSASLFGTTASRPVTGYLGMSYRDTTLGYRIWVRSTDGHGNITAWENAMGTKV